MKQLTSERDQKQWTNQALKELVDQFSVRGSSQYHLDYFDDQIIEQFDHFELEIYKVH